MKITKLISWHLVLELSNETLVKSVFAPVGTKLVSGIMEDNLFFFVAVKKKKIQCFNLSFNHKTYIALLIIFIVFRKGD